jgi:hypothetical protein
LPSLLERVTAKSGECLNSEYKTPPAPPLVERVVQNPKCYNIIMKKIFFYTIILILIFLGLGYYLGWMDNGPKPINVDAIPGRLDE